MIVDSPNIALVVPRPLLHVMRFLQHLLFAIEMHEFSSYHTPPNTNLLLLPKTHTPPHGSGLQFWYHERWHLNGILFKIVAKLTFGCINADLCEYISIFSAFWTLNSYPDIIPTSCQFSNLLHDFRTTNHTWTLQNFMSFISTDAHVRNMSSTFHDLKSTLLQKSKDTFKDLDNTDAKKAQDNHVLRNWIHLRRPVEFPLLFLEFDSNLNSW